VLLHPLVASNAVYAAAWCVHYRADNWLGAALYACVTLAPVSLFNCSSRVLKLCHVSHLAAEF